MMSIHMIVNIDLHLRITHESTGAYFQWGPYFNNNNTKIYYVKQRNVSKILVIVHNQGTIDNIVLPFIVHSTPKLPVRTPGV